MLYSFTQTKTTLQRYMCKAGRPGHHSRMDWTISPPRHPYCSSAAQSSCLAHSPGETSALPCCRTASSSASQPTTQPNENISKTVYRNLMTVLVSVPTRPLDLLSVYTAAKHQSEQQQT